ncbi:MAG: TIR domain-containing protein [Chloroflexi bacterium]|nr:TIR domain-containing protein [Chloroflexota bacterium]
MSHIYISYSRKDLEFSEKIVSALAVNAIETWIDWKSIPKGAEWEQEIYRGIEGADAFLLLMSPDSVKSEIIRQEIEHAVKNDKRFIPILIRDTDIQDVPPAITKYNWIFCREKDDFDSAIAATIKVILTDYEWLKYHTQLQLKALQWESRKDNSRLLRGKELKEAEQKFASIGTVKDPRPTHLQLQYISASRLIEKRRQRQVTIALSFAILTMAFLIAFASFAGRQANIQASQRQTAIAQAEKIQQEEIISLHATITYLEGVVQRQTPLVETPSNINTATSTTLTATSTPTISSTSTLIVTNSLSPTQTTTPSIAIQIYEEHKSDTLFWILSSIATVLSIYLMGILALLTVAWQFNGSRVFSQSWLTKIASKPLLVTPGLGTWALFLGYRKRLLTQRDVAKAKQEYFDLPILEKKNRELIKLEKEESTHTFFSRILRPKDPIIIIGNGGAGKTTFLARFAYLTLIGALPNSLKGYKPVFVTAVHYKDSLIKAIASTLRARDGVAVDEDSTQTQLETGKYLILFDGVSEVSSDAQIAMEEILKIANHTDYQNCRFVISTRPTINIPEDVSVFQLEPITRELVEEILPQVVSELEQVEFVKHQMATFGKKPIEPLLFSMIIAQSKEGSLSHTRARLFEKYFRHLLGVKNQENLWYGWSFVLELISEWSMLERGKRGLGIYHDTLVDKIMMWKEADISLLTKLEKYYGLRFKSELDMLERLCASSILNKEAKQYYFSHDSFEEFFAANRLISIQKNKGWSDLALWRINENQEKSFLGVIDFLDEFLIEMGPTGEEIRELILAKEKSELWKSHIKGK